MGYGAWGIGHGEDEGDEGDEEEGQFLLGAGEKLLPSAKSSLLPCLFPMPNAQCPMPHAQCPMPNAQLL